MQLLFECKINKFNKLIKQGNTRAIFLHFNLASLSPLTLNCEIPSINSEEREETFFKDFSLW